MRGIHWVLLIVGGCTSTAVTTGGDDDSDAAPMTTATTTTTTTTTATTTTTTTATTPDAAADTTAPDSGACTFGQCPAAAWDVAAVLDSAPSIGLCGEPREATADDCAQLPAVWYSCGTRPNTPPPWCRAVAGGLVVALCCGP